MANKKKGDVDSKFFIIEWVLKIKEKYGTLNIILSGFLMIFISLATTLAFNPSYIFEKYNAYYEKKHSESFDYRMRSSKSIQLLLEHCADECEAYRAFVIEMHNGKNNSTGLSFNYGSLTYEALSDSAESIMEDYADFSLERFPVIIKAYDEGFWHGTTTDLRIFDKKMALKLESNDAKYLALCVIYGVKNEIGFLGITYKDECAIREADIRSKLMKYASQVSPFLDGSMVK